MSDRTSVLIIYTGGTIGMIRHPETGSLKPFDFNQISKEVPALKKFGCKLSTISFEPPIDSSNVNPEIWIKLAKIIIENQDKYDGFVVLHGTDTMSYSASALSFLLENIYKPVIFTGSQLPIETVRTDGKENLITAIEIAAARQNDHPVVPEVCIYFENKLYRGNRTTKQNAENFNAFRSDNYPPLAEAGVHINYNHSLIYNPLQSKNRTGLKAIPKLQFDNNVAILKFFPGISENAVKAILGTPGIKALVLETFGAGNTTTAQWFIKAIRQAVEKGMYILNVSQCSAGSVEMGRYETSVPLLEAGVLSGYDITVEAAITKFMFLLAQDLSKEEVIFNMQNSIAGEVTITNFQQLD